MQIVIDIPEKLYKHVQQIGSINMLATQQVANAIFDGTPLPKGHGDLKDMDDIYEALEGWNDDTGWIVDAIDWQAPTIIEADKAESESKE